MNKESKFYYGDGTISSTYYKNRILHRVGGPAVEWNYGGRWWYLDDKLHRTDGPAMEYADGGKRWYIDGMNYSEKQFNNLIKQVNEMSTVMKLTDPRWWVRELGEKETHVRKK